MLAALTDRAGQTNKQTNLLFAQRLRRRRRRWRPPCSHSISPIPIIQPPSSIIPTPSYHPNTPHSIRNAGYVPSPNPPNPRRGVGVGLPNSDLGVSRRLDRGSAAGLRLRAGVADDDGGGAGLALAGLRGSGSLGAVPTCQGSWRGIVDCLLCVCVRGTGGGEEVRGGRLRCLPSFVRRIGRVRLGDAWCVSRLTKRFVAARMRWVGMSDRMAFQDLWFR